MVVLPEAPYLATENLKGADVSSGDSPVNKRKTVRYCSNADKSDNDNEEKKLRYCSSNDDKSSNDNDN